ncbi:MAG: hypothetical protein JW884_10530 [Deltaproteobacteria bacterium]|nr:hypothetical protein [Deltaproteobacteria bacterium]
MKSFTVMNNLDQRERIIEYVLARRCESGGFCFYKLDEPNGSDCYYALSILNQLDVPFHDDKTVAWLQNMQHDDGSYDSIFNAFYSLKSLRFLNEKPTRDLAPYLLKHLQHYAVDVRKLPAEILSIFKRLIYLVDLYRTVEMERDEMIESNIIRFIFSFENEDRGFGYIQSNLTETSRALAILDMLDYPVKELETEQFIRRCEMPLFGFTDVPHSSLSYMEYIHAGVLASSIISYRPRYHDRCVDFILNCQNKSGGFSRSPHAGIATMENAYYAISSFKFLSILGG